LVYGEIMNDEFVDRDSKIMGVIMSGRGLPKVGT